ncbi:MAG: hypothetical protein DIZ80_12175 [endosymbiont of Galathealinum brachiosum]|uniref:Peptidase M48 domain-containing protein n=1 Tax=endosymbiont of Galathealinum brachiosum TaxID=2200906 RepID=A0A370DDM2_9GAMM|nr:MAG: hypothetical protein DIZ80_12175 [endosymbiont of Galathealinum brachiosum]
MDFFSQQEKAKRYTKILLLYFLIAVTFIVVAVNVVIYYFFIFLEFYPYTPQDWFSSSMVFYVSITTCFLILSGSLFRWFKLKSGGQAVALMVGAKKIDLHTSDIKQRQLINVVEEMSIASGVPVPELYLLERESGINAFVAGYLPTEAVMVVTAGAVENFTREELQGVVAHEYSHILNGDMQINIHLLSMLAGILMISSVGHLLMNSDNHLVRNRNFSALMVLGFLLSLIGYIGVLSGRLIKAAVSRQREYLADAAAVQFTRNPGGIASALNKIRNVKAGSRLNNIYSEDLSHMFFAQSLKMKLTSWLATHPSLILRIKRIDPGFVARIKARKLNVKNKETNSQKNMGELNELVSSIDSIVSFPENMESVPAIVTAHEFAESAGNISQAHMEFATVVHQSFSFELMQAVHKVESAKMLVLNLILVRMNIDSGFEFLKKHLNKNELNVLKKFNSEIKRLENYKRLPLLELLLPTLKLMTDSEKTDYLILCEKFIKSDGRYTLFEFVFLSLLKQHLAFESGKEITVKHHSYKQVNKELQLLFSIMSHSSRSLSELRHESYNKVVKYFPMSTLDKTSGELFNLLDFKEITPKKISAALKALAQLSPLLKRGVIEASADIAMHDGQLKYTEAELLRVIADILGCPLPPLLPQAVN